MSLASHNPEMFDAACVTAIAAHIYRQTKREWCPGTDLEQFEEIESAVATLQQSSEPGLQAVFDVLMNLPGVSSDALDRFHEMFR